MNKQAPIAAQNKGLPRELVDRFGRHVTYLRVSVTDRCDFRCTYCMAETMDFLPRQELLSFEELDHIITRFVDHGVTKVRITGGEPLVRKDVMGLFERLSRHLDSGALQELTLTSNGSQLPRFADRLAALGVKRVNISLDTLNEDRFAKLTRIAKLHQTLDGIDAALEAGLHVKLNTVALKGVNEDELDQLVTFAHARNMDISFIETMPLGNVDHREDHYLPLTEVRQRFEQTWTLTDLADDTGGPSRYARVQQTGGRIGFISPLTNNFCAGCNRVRLTCTGQLYMCLGHDDAVDLRAAVRSTDPEAALADAFEQAMIGKPKQHDFAIDRMAVSRAMSVTGG